MDMLFELSGWKVVVEDKGIPFSNTLCLEHFTSGCVTISSTADRANRC